MVLRNKKLSSNSATAELSVSYGLPDVKAMLRLYVSLDGVIEEIYKTISVTEHDVRYFLEQEGRAFQSYPDKWREQLSAWAFAVAVKNRLLIPTATNPDKYYFADCLFKKAGRPRIEE